MLGMKVTPVNSPRVSPNSPDFPFLHLYVYRYMYWCFAPWVVRSTLNSNAVIFMFFSFIVGALLQYTLGYLHFFFSFFYLSLINVGSSSLFSSSTSPASGDGLGAASHPRPVYGHEVK